MGGVTVYPVADAIAYRNGDGTGAEDTRYAYTYSTAGSGFALATVVMTLPAVTTAEDGPGTATTVTSVYDADGHVVWQRDPNGTLGYAAYDPATGGLLTSIVDVDTADTGDFDAGLRPAGWATPSGGGLERVTAYQLDDQGRTTEQVSPGGDSTVVDSSLERTIAEGSSHSSFSRLRGNLATAIDFP